MRVLDIEGFRPEWFIFTIIYSQDILFWLETLSMQCCSSLIDSHILSSGMMVFKCIFVAGHHPSNM